MSAVHLNPPVHHPWMDDAACLDVDPDMFFATDWHEVERAKNICDGCPVRRQCLQLALNNVEQYGVFGGLTREQRRRVANKGAA